MCSVPDCERWFHLPCAKEGGCVNVYATPFSSFCPEHRQEQEVEVTPEPDTVCPICMEPVEDRKTFTTLVCPTCQRAWFHRDCIQGQAMRAGALYFQCPLCRDSEEFPIEMFMLGIRVPFRQPTWEDNNAFAELEERHGQCNARECLYPGGREEAEEEGPWELLLCSSCAAEGTHRRCSGLRNSTRIWECDTCAGLGTSSRDEAELNGPRLTRQSGLGPSHGSSQSEAISPSSHTPVPLVLVSPSPDTGSHSRPQHAAWQQELPSSSLDFSSIRSRSRRDRSSGTGPRAERPRQRETPARTSPRHSRSHQQGWAQSPPVRSRSRRDRNSGTGPRAERPRHRETSSGPSPRRSRSRQQGRAQSPPVRSRSRRDRSSRTRARTERPRRRDTSSGTPPRRSRSRQQRRASTQRVRSRSRQDRSRRTAASAERPRRRGTWSGTSRRSSRSHQRRRRSTGTSKSST